MAAAAFKNLIPLVSQNSYTISVRAVQAVMAAMRALQHPVAGIMARCGITPAALDRADGQILFLAMVHFWQEAIAETGDPTWGCIWERQPPSIRWGCTPTPLFPAPRCGMACAAAAVAEALHISMRTLHRGLKAEDETFRRLISGEPLLESHRKPKRLHE